MKKRIGALLTAVAACALVCSCAPTHVAVQSHYDADQYVGYRSNGNNSIRGQAFLLKRGGGVVTCAGRSVLLAPDSPYFREIAAIAVKGSKPDFPQGEGGPDDVLRHTTCDAQGNFGFSNVPDGRYILMANVKWMAGDLEQGGVFWEPGVLDGGVHKRVVMSNSVFDANRASH